MINIAVILKHNVIGKLLNHVVVFLINVFIVRLLGAGESGIYFNELYLLNFIVFIFSAGLDYAAIAFIAAKPSLLPRVNKLLLGIVFIFAALVAGYVLLLNPIHFDLVSQPAIAIILFSIGNLLLIFYQGVLSALKKFNLQNLVLGVTNALYLVYILAFFKAGDKNIFESIAISYAILFFIQGMMMLILSFTKNTDETASLNGKAFFRSGVFIMVSSLVYFGFLRVDNFFVEKYETGVILGNYVQCGKIGQYFLYFSSIISSTLLPFISTETVGASYVEWKKMMKPYILLLCAAAIFIVVTGPYLFPFLFGEEFEAMYNYMMILLPGFLCLGMLTLLNAVYIGKGNIRRIFLGDLMGLVLVVTLDALLVPRYGVYAAAFISSGCYCIVFLFLWAGFKKQFDLPAKIKQTA